MSRVGAAWMALMLVAVVSRVGNAEPPGSASATVARPLGDASTPDAPSAAPTTSVDDGNAEQLEARFASDEGEALEGYESPGFGRSFLEMLLVLGMVCVLAYVLLGKVLPRLMRVPLPSASGRLLAVVDRMAIDARRSIVVVRMGEQYFLVGNAEQGMSLLARLDPSEVRDAMAAASLTEPTQPWSGWTTFFRRRTGAQPR